jgi:hypothetical protein
MRASVQVFSGRATEPVWFLKLWRKQSVSTLIKGCVPVGTINRSKQLQTFVEKGWRREVSVEYILEFPFFVSKSIFESLFWSTSTMGRTQYTNPWVLKEHTQVTGCMAVEAGRANLYAQVPTLSRILYGPNNLKASLGQGRFTTEDCTYGCSLRYTWSPTVYSLSERWRLACNFMWFYVLARWTLSCSRWAWRSHSSGEKNAFNPGL